MKYGEIANMPTSLMQEDIAARPGCKGFHESVLRSYHILRKVKWLLEKGADTEIILILELIALMESDDFKPYGQIQHEAKHPIQIEQMVTSLDTIGPQWSKEKKD